MHVCCCGSSEGQDQARGKLIGSAFPSKRHTVCEQVTPQKLALMDGSVDAWCQVACPRLSIDWGEAFKVQSPARRPPLGFAASGPRVLPGLQNSMSIACLCQSAPFVNSKIDSSVTAHNLNS